MTEISIGFAVETVNCFSDIHYFASIYISDSNDVEYVMVSQNGATDSPAPQFNKKEAIKDTKSFSGQLNNVFQNVTTSSLLIFT